MIWIRYMNVICLATVLTSYAVLAESRRDARIYTQSIIGWLDSKYILTYCGKCPGSCTCKPAVLAFTKCWSICTCNHLAVCIWLCSMDFTNFLKEYRISLGINLISSITMPNCSFSTCNPRIVVAEDSGILFVSRWIRRNLTEFYMVSCISWLIQHNSVFAIKSFFDRSQSCLSFAIFDSDTLRPRVWPRRPRAPPSAA